MDLCLYTQDWLRHGLRGAPPDQELPPPGVVERLLVAMLSGLVPCTVALFWLLSRIPLVDALLQMFVTHYPRGAVGYLLRGAYFKNKLRRMGRNVIIDVGAILWPPENIEIGDNPHIDIGAKIIAGGKGYGYVRIGRYCRVAYNCYLQGRAGIELQDWVGLAGQTAIFSASNYYEDPARPGVLVSMTGMAPESEQYVISSPVVIEHHAAIALQCVVVPGVKIGHHAYVTANSLVTKDVPPLAVVGGSPARVIARRVGEPQPAEPGGQAHG